MDFQSIKANADMVSHLLKMLSNRSRLMVVCELTQGERSVGALVERVGLSQSALSQHLARLRAARIVRTRRENQTIYYSIASTRTAAMLDALCAIYSTGDAEQQQGETSDVH